MKTGRKFFICYSVLRFKLAINTNVKRVFYIAYNLLIFVLNLKDSFGNMPSSMKLQLNTK